jgi:uncharacterized protein (TIGR03086 family)
MPPCIAVERSAGQATFRAAGAYDPTMTEVHDRYRLVSSGFDAAVNAVGPDGWDTPSPCEGWTARDVVAHIVAGHRGVMANARGDESVAPGADEDPTEAWREASREMAGLTEDPEAMAKEVDGPTGTMPVGEIINRFVCMDLLVHTWDLAHSVGADDRLDEDSVRQAFEAMKPMDAMIRQPGVFGPKLEPPAGADLQTEFLCFLGRDA